MASTNSEKPCISLQQYEILIFLPQFTKSHTSTNALDSGGRIKNCTWWAQSIQKYLVDG